MTQFAVRLQEIARGVNQRADMIVRDVLVEIPTSLIDRSPVGDPSLWQKPAPKGYKPGTFRGNWQLGVGSIPEGETGRVDPDGGATLEAIVAAIPDHPSGMVFYYANNVPYARPIEDGHSTQAPNGLVGLTAVEFQGYVDGAAAKVAA